MRCPKCGADASVRDSRERPDGSRWRRYLCACCGKRFSTLERIAQLPQHAGKRREGCS